MLLDAAAVLGIGAVLGAILLVVLSASGSSLLGDARGTLVLDDGTVLHYRSEPERRAIVGEHRDRILSVTIEGADVRPGILRVSFAAIYLVGFGYVALLERRRLRGWLRAGPRRIAIGLALGLATAAVGIVYEKAADRFGVTSEGYPLPLRQIGIAPFLALAVVAAPLVEELYFRGRLFRLVEERNGGRAALWITSVIFAAIHVPTMPLAFPPYLVVSLVLGWQRLRNGTLDGSIATHAMQNALAVAATFLGV